MWNRVLLAVVLILVGGAWPVQAAMQIVTGTGEYRMGDYESKQEAVRLATEVAKRDVLEQVVTYVNSLTVVKDLAIVKDEIRSYTAGAINIIDKQVQTRFDGGSLIIHVEVTGRVDPEEVAKAVMAERQKRTLSPIPLSSRRLKDFPRSPLYNRVQHFTDRVFTPKEIEEAAFHHRGEKHKKLDCDAAGNSCSNIDVRWSGLTQEDMDDINRLNELERRFAFDPESFFNSPACAKSLLNETCIEELQDAGVPHHEIMRQFRLRAEAQAEAQRKVDEIKAAQYRKEMQAKEAAEKAAQLVRVQGDAKREAARKEKEAEEARRNRMINDLTKDIMANRFVPDMPRQGRGLNELLQTPQSPIGVATWIILDREGYHDPAKWIAEHGNESQDCGRRPVVDACITALIHAEFSVNEVGEWIVE